MATVTRVLPWRRAAAPVHTEIQGVVDRYKARWPKSSADLLVRAYEMAVARRGRGYGYRTARNRE